MLFTSQVIASASGSAGGLTASRNRFGNYFRTRAVPVQPNTSRQQFVKAAFAALSVRWTGLTQAQRDTWDLYAENTPVTNKLGLTVLLTGLNMYIRNNLPRDQASFTVIDTAPSIFGLGLFRPVLDFAAVAATDTLTVTWNADDGWDDADGAGLLLYVGRPQSPSVHFYKGPFAFTGSVNGSSTTPPLTPTDTISVEPFVAGQAIFLRLQVTEADTRLSTQQILTTIAT